MNKKKHCLRLLMLTFVAIVALTSCQDDDNFVPSTVDPKEWDLDTNIDPTFKPGDNFYRYCIGTWWNATDLGDADIFGTRIYNDRLNNERVATINAKDKILLKYNFDLLRVDQTVDEARTFIQQLTNELTSDIHTREDAWRAIGKAIKKGLIPFFYFEVVPKDGIYYTVPIPTYYLGTNSLKIFNDYSLKNIRKHPKLRDQLIPFSQVRTRAGAASGVLTTVLKEIGIDSKFVQLPDEQKEYLDVIEKMSPEDISEIIKQTINMKLLLFVSSKDLASYNAALGTSTTFSDWGEIYRRSYMMYVYSRAYANLFVTPEIKTKWTAICEDIRSTFNERINNLDWMSSTTKINAQKKLKAMTFNVAYPDHWYDEGFPQLENSKSFVEDQQKILQSYFNISKILIGKSIKEEGFTFDISNFADLSLLNAFYDPMQNSITIYPSILLPPMYNERQSDAILYSTATIIGHEITHGFDNEGSQYDELGNSRNWWTVSDKMDYEAKQQLLIDCYNKLEIMPDELPGTYANGTQTLGENIADLGGFEIARQCYLTKLIQEGYTGSELIKQEKRFFQAYADLWQSKYTPVHAKKMLQIDVHSLSQERINGVVMNCDRWYDLYDVKWGNILYLRPEQRSHIW